MNWARRALTSVVDFISYMSRLENGRYVSDRTEFSAGTVPVPPVPPASRYVTDDDKKAKSSRLKANLKRDIRDPVFLPIDSFANDLLPRLKESNDQDHLLFWSKVALAKAYNAGRTFELDRTERLLK